MSMCVCSMFNVHSLALCGAHHDIAQNKNIIYTWLGEYLRLNAVILTKRLSSGMFLMWPHRLNGKDAIKFCWQCFGNAIHSIYESHCNLCSVVHLSRRNSFDFDAVFIFSPLAMWNKRNAKWYVWLCVQCTHTVGSNYHTLRSSGMMWSFVRLSSISRLYYWLRSWLTTIHK